MKKNTLRILSLLWAASFVFTGCVANKYKPASNVVELKISFADSKWNGKEIPNGQQCGKFGGNASTPQLIVGNIPPEANALVMEYSDRNSRRMNNGGHGKIGYRIKSGSHQVVIPSVPGHTFDLPKDFFLIAAHKNPAWDKAGAYMPPCSGGKGNLYVVEVKAVHDAPDGQDSLILGQGILTLGRY